MASRRIPSILIVGGGFSGTLLATQILRRAQDPIAVTVVERSSLLGAGVAYRTSCPDHFLNVRAKQMSAIATEGDHFVRWLAGAGVESAGRWGVTADPDAFVPRGLYGEYVRAVLDEADGASASDVTLARVQGEGVAAETIGAGLQIRLADRSVHEADQVVLALGNAAPSHPTVERSDFYESAAYVRDPWKEEALRGLDLDTPVLIVGSHLTMIDLAIALARMGHRGEIHAISRHGLLPREHPAASHPTGGRDLLSESFSEVELPSVRGALEEIRRRVLEESRRGIAWTSVIDALRPYSQRVWRGWTQEERRRFVRHARAYWEVHRHRAVPANMRDLERLRSSGQLHLHAGRIQGFDEEGPRVRARITPRGTDRVVPILVGRVFNATGPAGDYRGGSVLVEQLIRGGYARAGPLGLGLDATQEGCLLDGSGRESAHFSTLGPPLRGVLGETTAVPEIRDQAAALATRLLERTRRSARV